MKKYWIICLLIALTMTACEKIENEHQEIVDTGTFYHESFVTTYVVPNELRLDSETTTRLPGVKFRLSGDRFSYDSRDAETVARFNEYATKYDDHHFNRTTLCPDVMACGEGITAIRVTSTSDYDAAHPAATLLNDIVLAKWQTCYPFVKEQCPKSWHGGEWWTSFSLLLNEVNPEDLILLRLDGGLKFMAKPDPMTDQIPLQVEFEFENGAIISSLVVMEVR